MADDNNNKTDYTSFDYLTTKSEDYLSMSSNELLQKTRSQYDQQYNSAIYSTHKFLQSACSHCASILDKTTDIIRAKGELLKNGVNIFAYTPEPAAQSIGNTALVIPKLTAESDMQNRYETPMGYTDGGSSSGGSIGAVEQLTGSDATEQVYNFLTKSMGLSTELACGIMGNWQQENNFSPEDNSGGLGICQWTGSRRENCINMFPDSYETLPAQLSFFKWETENDESSSFQEVLNYGASTPEEYAYAFCDKYERAGMPMMEQREGYARQFFELYGNK